MFWRRRNKHADLCGTHSTGGATTRGLEVRKAEERLKARYEPLVDELKDIMKRQIAAAYGPGDKVRYRGEAVEVMEIGGQLVAEVDDMYDWDNARMVVRPFVKLLAPWGHREPTVVVAGEGVRYIEAVNGGARFIWHRSK